jgi:hypothetical protein
MTKVRRNTLFLWHLKSLGLLHPLRPCPSHGLHHKPRGPRPWPASPMPKSVPDPVSEWAGREIEEVWMIKGSLNAPTAMRVCACGGTLLMDSSVDRLGGHMEN